MQIDRVSLLADLELVKAGLSAREFIEQSSCFVFREGTLMTFNDEIACRKRVGISITGAIPAPALLNILTKIEEKDLMVRENNKGELEFKGKRKGFGVTMDAEILLPMNQVETPKKGTWMPVPESFVEAVGLVQHCVSKDETRFLLTCIHLHPDFIEACDNYQILRYSVETGLPKPVLVRGSSIANILNLGMHEMALTKNWLHFRNKAGLLFSCRRYHEEYHSLDAMLAFDGHPIEFPTGLKEAGDRAAVFAMDNAGSPMVNVTLMPGKMRIVGRGLSGWYREVKSVVYDGPPLEFLIAPELLEHVSTNYKSAEITEDRMRVSKKNWKYITSLAIRQEEEETASEE